MRRTKSPSGLSHKLEGPRGDERTVCGVFLRNRPNGPIADGWSDPIELESFVPPSPRCNRCWPEQAGNPNAEGEDG